MSEDQDAEESAYLRGQESIIDQIRLVLDANDLRQPFIPLVAPEMHAHDGRVYVPVEHVQEALAIVRDLAASDPRGVDGCGYTICRFCPDDVYTDDDEHEPACPYRRAKELLSDG